MFVTETNPQLGTAGLSKASQPPRLVFALSEDDKRRFLPETDIENLLPLDCRWLDVSGLSAEAWEKALFELRPEILVTAWGTPPMPQSFASSSDLSLRYICHLTGGVKSVAPRLLLERGVLVSNWGTTISYTIAEHAILLTLAALRNLPLWNDFQDTPADRVTRLRIQSLRGNRVGIHGFGGIAREIVGMLKGFQVEISAYSWGVPEELFANHGVKRCESLDELFSSSDIVIECEALTPRSRGSVTGAVLGLLPDDGVFVNVGRGAVVEEKALLHMASEGRLRVALDTYDPEPLPADSPWFAIPSACLSPHIAGPTANGFRLCGEFAMKNLRKYLDGATPDGLVTLEVYDRMT